MSKNLLLRVTPEITLKQAQDDFLKKLNMKEIISDEDINEVFMQFACEEFTESEYKSLNTKSICKKKSKSKNKSKVK